MRALTDLVASDMGLSRHDADRLRWAALLHDIGKLAVPAKILNKPGKPDAREWNLLQRHPEEGAKLIGPLAAWLGEWASAVDSHHERYDETGYPRGLAGTDRLSRRAPGRDDDAQHHDRRLHHGVRHRDREADRPDDAVVGPGLDALRRRVALDPRPVTEGRRGQIA